MQRIYEKSYSNQGNIDLISKIPPEVKFILDVGCGTGDNAKNLSAKGCVVDGITISEKEAVIAKQFLRFVYLHDLEKGLPELKQKYDAVICSHVLEHIAYPQRILSEIKDNLTGDGILIVALPNVMHYKSRFQLLKGNFLSQESGIWDNTHLRWYTYQSGRLLLESAGFIIRHSWVSGHLPINSLLKKLPERVQRTIFNLLTYISKGFFGEQLLYIAKAQR